MTTIAESLAKVYTFARSQYAESPKHWAKEYAGATFEILEYLNTQRKLRTAYFAEANDSMQTLENHDMYSRLFEKTQRDVSIMETALFGDNT